MGRKTYALTQHKSHGFALLAMLGILIIALTAVAMTRLSMNDTMQKRLALSQQTLGSTRDAIMAWTITRTFTTLLPPGTLPCPDTDTNRDGNSNTIAGGICVNRVGLVPFRDLGIPEPLDAYGNPLWYAVATEYVGNVNAAITQRNSSLESTLLLDSNGTSSPVAFILIAPNGPVDPQVQQTRPVANITQFLEAENSDNDNVFSDLRDETHNDQVLAMHVSAFWSQVEERAMIDMAALLNQYFTTCNSYPWAVPFTNVVNNGVPNTFQGRLPTTNEWGMPCHPPSAAVTAPAFQPQWLLDHWGNFFYYAICREATPINPPATSCLNLGNGLTARVILIGPGTELTGQDRSILNIANYLENENRVPVDNVFQKLPYTNHTAAFNDVIKRVAP